MGITKACSVRFGPLSHALRTENTLNKKITLTQNPARRYLADPRFQKALEVGLGINMTTGDAFARGKGAGAAPPGARGAEASTAAPMEEEEYDDDDDGPPPLEVRGAGAGCWRLCKAWC